MKSSGNGDVSVIVLTKNSVRTIDGCLQTIMREKPGEVVAIDALSTDGTLDILSRYGVRTITDALGSMGHSRRLGVETARGTYVMFVDSDVELGAGCVGRLRSDLERHKWAGVHANLLSSENASYWQRSEDAKFRRKYGRPGPTNYIDTIVALFRKEDLVRHPFDPYFRESAEDVDLSRRLVSENCLLGISSAVAHHRHRREFSGFARQRFNYGLGTARLALKYGSLGTLLGPLLAAFSKSIRAIVAHEANMIPYWLIGGVVRFTGAIIGFSRAYRSYRAYCGSG